jgi:chromosome segregation ATPase
MMKKNEYLRTLEEQLERLEAEIAKLKIKSERAGADLKAGYDEIIADLKLRSIELRPKIRELRRAGDDAWVDVRAGLEDAWGDLKKAVGSAVSRFR